MRHLCLYVVLASLFLLGEAAAAVAGGRPLDDAELDSIAAGGLSVQALDSAFAFQFRSAGRGFSMDGNATIVQLANEATANVGSIVLRDSAQSNLSSLINVTAVNSPINILLNLNVNIHSNVGIVRQLNLTGGF